MIERLLIAAVFLTALILLGQAVRVIVAARARRIAAAVAVAASAAGAPRLMVFSSRWCSDCAIQHEVIERARETWPRPVEISYHDAVAERDLAHQLGILLVPAIVVANAAGGIVEIRQGLVDEDRLRSLLETAA